MTGAKFNIKKFDVTCDFGLWRVKMHALLIQHRCEVDLEVLLTDMEAESKDVLNKKSHSAVILCLGNKVLREVTEQMTAAGVWLKLETLYMKNPLANMLYLKKKLYTFYMLVGLKISEHIDEFNKSILDLANIEVTFEDEDLALLLLTSLLASYEHFVDTLLYGREALTLKDVMDTLNLKDIKERSKAKGDNGEGLYVRGRTDRRDSHRLREISRSKYQGGRLKCYIFQSEDHLKRNHLKNNRKKSTGYVKKDDQPSSSGSIYDECDGCMVLLGDNTECKIIELEGTITYSLWMAMQWQVSLMPVLKKKTVIDVGNRLGRLDQDLTEVESLRGKRYFLSIVDAYSRRVWVYILRFKHEAFRKFKEWKQLVENQTGRTVKKLRTNNGCEGYILYRLDDESPKIVTKRNVVFNESVMYKDTFKDSGVEHGDGVTSIKRRRHDFQSDDVKDFVMASKHSRLKEDLESSTWRQRHGFKVTSSRRFSYKYKTDFRDANPTRTLRDYSRPSHEGYRNTIKLPEGNNVEDGDDEDAEDQETDQTPDLTDYQFVRDKKPRTRTKPLRFQYESNMVAYAFVAVEEEDTHEPLTYQEGVAYDMMISCKSKAEIGSIKSLLKKEFDIKELGEAKNILGMKIVRDQSRKILRMSQFGYVSKILNNFRIKNEKSVEMPLCGHFKMSLKDCAFRDCNVERMSKVSYANAVGSLMYLMEAVKWILKYLRGTTNVRLVYQTDHGNHVDVISFVDSNYIKDPDKEAKYMALTEAVKEAIG
nr:retrovirus-related Pol polyprotein from transposon TNT 1-94 [Tanacetum cinerariifolium]